MPLMQLKVQQKIKQGTLFENTQIKVYVSVWWGLEISLEKTLMLGTIEGKRRRG